MELPFSITFAEVERHPVLVLDDSDKWLWMSCNVDSVKRATLGRALAAAYNGSRLVLPDGVKAPRRWELLKFCYQPQIGACCLLEEGTPRRQVIRPGQMRRGFVIGVGLAFEELLRVLAERYNRFAEIRNGVAA